MWAFLRASLACVLLMTVAIAMDFGHTRQGRPATDGSHPYLKFMIGFAVLGAVMAFGDAWSWAGRSGPVKRLTALAFGTGFGFAIPAVIAVHGLYFGWLDPVAVVLGRELVGWWQAGFAGYSRTG